MTQALSKERLEQIIETADEIITVNNGTNEDISKNDTKAIIGLYDHLNDDLAPPAVVKELARFALAAYEQEPVAPSPTAEHRRVIEMLLTVCGAAFELADDSCEQEVDGETCTVVPSGAFQKLSDALDEIENSLPTEDADRPDVFLAWAAMPRAALKSLLHPAPSIPTVSFYRDGIAAAADWVDKQREAYDNEHGRTDPDTNAFEFCNDAQQEYSSTLAEIAEGIRALHPNAASEPSIRATQAIPDEKPMPQASTMHAIDAVEEIAKVMGWNACRAAMLQAEPAGWIPVSERLPDETTDDDGGATGYLVRYAQGKEPNGGFNVGVWNVTYLLRHHHGIITHWQPLPAPPKGV